MIKRFLIRILTLVEWLLLKVPIRPSRPIVFITGAPRSGTTLTYQYFVELGDFCFFTNRERKYSKFPVISALIFRGAHKYDVTHENSYGHIPGINSPSDGWEIFHRWFPYYYDPDDPIRKGAGLEMYRTIAWLQWIYGRPFIVKNNANSLRIREIKSVFPDAIFVHVHRNTEEVVESIVQGMEKNKINRPGLWGTGPKLDIIPAHVITNFDKARFQVGYVDDYVKQFEYVHHIEFDKANTAQLKSQVLSIINEL